MGKREIFFVVYTGRTPGIFKYWDVAAKHGFQLQGSRYNLFPSFKQALASWLQFCIQSAAAERAKECQKRLTRGEGVNGSHKQSMFRGMMF